MRLIFSTPGRHFLLNVSRLKGFFAAYIITNILPIQVTTIPLIYQTDQLDANYGNKCLLLCLKGKRCGCCLFHTLHSISQSFSQPASHVDEVVTRENQINKTHIIVYLLVSSSDSIYKSLPRSVNSIICIKVN